MYNLSSASLLQCPHFRSSRPELLCKKGVLKNFANFTDVSSGTGVPYEFCDILKNTFFRKNTSGGCFKIFYSNTVCNKAAETWICLVSFCSGAKDFIFTCIFLKISLSWFKYKHDIVFSVFLSLDQNLITEKRSSI